MKERANSIANNPKHYSFISYSSKNRDWAESVRMIFDVDGISCWMAPYDIPVGSNYLEVIDGALENCSCFVLLLTADSQNSQYVAREAERALAYNKPIIPLKFYLFFSL